MSETIVGKKVLVVGGGIAGLTSAWELSRLGVETTLIDQSPVWGGHLARFSCKAVETCKTCGVCLAEDVMERIYESSLIHLLLNTSVTSAKRESRHYSVCMTSRDAAPMPDGVHLADLCPVQNALVSYKNGFYLNREHCLYFQDESCRICLDTHPENQALFHPETQQLESRVDAVVLATGFETFDPSERPAWGYGSVRGVHTAEEMEPALRTNEWSAPAGSTVAFVQCVGSRDKRLGRNYCSRACCAYALRMANVLAAKHGTKVTIFYMDLQSMERAATLTSTEMSRLFEFIRARPGSITEGQDGRPVIVYSSQDGKPVSAAFDKVILSVGMSPGHSTRRLSEIFGVHTNANGFLGPNDEGVCTNLPGVFVAGTAQGPRSINDSVSHALRCVGRVADYLASEETRS